ncbi:hypothetical protein FXO37_22674 [Capsicum annuum]|nr:hypothetical protein FXO37_22674 [Capsicum annuum]
MHEGTLRCEGNTTKSVSGEGFHMYLVRIGMVCIYSARIYIRYYYNKVTRTSKWRIPDEVKVMLDLNPICSETTTTQYAVVYGDGFSSENREASSQWRKVQDRLETNERCSRLEKINLLEIFQEYIRDLESEEEEQRKLWMIKDFAAYLAISLNTSGSTAKDLFTDVMDELEKQITLNKWRNVGIHERNFIPITLLVIYTLYGWYLIFWVSRLYFQIGLTLSWMLDDFKVAIAKYISSPPMSDTNLKFVFEKLLERAREKEEKEAKKRKRLADEFYELLRASKEITASSKWEDCKSLFGDRQVASFSFIDLELVTRLQEPLENDN